MKRLHYGLAIALALLIVGAVGLYSCSKYSSQSPSPRSNVHSTQRAITSGDAIALVDSPALIVGTTDGYGSITLSSFTFGNFTYDGTVYSVSGPTLVGNAITDSALYIEFLLTPNIGDKHLVAIPVGVYDGNGNAKGTTTTTTNSCSGCAHCDFDRDANKNITGCICQETVNDPDPAKRGSGCTHTITTTTTTSTKMAAFRSFIMGQISAQL